MLSKRERASAAILLGPMSPENVEVVLRSLDAFNADEQAWLETLDPEFEWYPVEEGHIPAYGHEGARGVRERWLGSFEGHSGEVEEVRADGEHVITTVHLTGQGRESGVGVDIRLFMPVSYTHLTLPTN